MSLRGIIRFVLKWVADVIVRVRNMKHTFEQTQNLWHDWESFVAKR